MDLSIFSYHSLNLILFCLHSNFILFSYNMRDLYVMIDFYYLLIFIILITIMTLLTVFDRIVCVIVIFMYF